MMELRVSGHRHVKDPPNDTTGSQQEMFDPGAQGLYLVGPYHLLTVVEGTSQNTGGLMPPLFTSLDPSLRSGTKSNS